MKNIKEKKDKDNINNKIEKFLKEYFQLLELDVDLEIGLEEDFYLTKITTKNDVSGLLIGNKGRNIISLQQIINTVFRSDLEGKRIIIDVDNWRDRETDRLKDLADKTAARVIESNTPQTLYNLSASQRRIIHMFLSDKNVKTESFGEGESRYLVISPK